MPLHWRAIFFVLYPAQARGANPGRCWNWFKHNHQERGRGEPALIAGMVRDVIERYGLDVDRVYIAGLSAGGAMAAIMGHAYPELFAAVGVHSGLRAGAASDLPSALMAMNSGAARPAPSAQNLPTIVFHGDQDRTVHPSNGEQVVAFATAPFVERGGSAHGREYSRSIYRNAAQEVVAEHWLVHGGGHAWAGGSAAGSYTDAEGPDATEAMLRFFFANAKA